MAYFPKTIELDKLQGSGIEIQQIDPIIENHWDDIIASQVDSSIFHHSAWARVLMETYRHQPFYLKISVQGAEAALVPLMEVKSHLTGNRGVSLPFSDFAGPLWTDANRSREIYSALFELAIVRKWKHLEIRGGLTPPEEGIPFQNYDNHFLDLQEGADSVYRNVDPSVRRAIRKCDSSGLKVTVERSLKAMDEFYILHGHTRRRHGLPPQPRKFFQSIARHLVERNFGIVVIARFEGIPVAGAVFLHFGRRAIYKFGASDKEHWPMRPNHGVMWAGIQELIKMGCDQLQFGRTSTADEGLARFKLSWGSMNSSLYYFRRDCRANTWLVANQVPTESHPLIFGHLPIACNRLAGILIYPHLD